MVDQEWIKKYKNVTLCFKKVCFFTAAIFSFKSRADQETKNYLIKWCKEVSVRLNTCSLSTSKSICMKSGKPELAT